MCPLVHGVTTQNTTHGHLRRTSAGVALTATTGNDTIGMFGPITATPTLSSATVISDAGNDLINLGVQGLLQLQLSLVSLLVTAEVFLHVLLVKTPSIPPTRVAPAQHWSLGFRYWCYNLYQALRKMVGSQIYANAGNDTIALGVGWTLPLLQPSAVELVAM